MSQVVYLLHFDHPYKHAQHYVGYAEDLARRLNHHADGTGANLMKVIKQNGIGFTLARVWDGATRTDERKIKNAGGGRRYCPICNKYHDLIFKTKKKSLKPFVK